jgi:hypothetical protein
LPKVVPKERSRREVFCSQFDYPTVRSTLAGFKVLLDPGLERGQVYAYWPGRRRVWFTVKRQNVIIEQVGG